MKPSIIEYNHARSNRNLACEVSSAASYLFVAARHAFLNCPCCSNFRSRADSEARLCHIEIDTSGAHSLRTRPLSKDWKALMRYDNRCVRRPIAKVLSMLIDNIRRNKEENRPGSFVNTSGIRQYPDFLHLLLVAYSRLVGSLCS